MNDPKIITLPETQLVGMRLEMSRVNDQTPQLWGSFMPRRNEVETAELSHFYSVNIYPRNYDPATFSATHIFTKWAAVKVESADNLPSQMEALSIPKSQYAVFQHKGNIQKFIENIMFVFNKWLPKSGFELNDRPHFERLPANYPGPNDPHAEEEIWVPIKG